LVDVDGRLFEFYEITLGGIDLFGVLLWVANGNGGVFLNREEFLEFGSFGKKSNENWLKKHGISEI